MIGPQMINIFRMQLRVVKARFNGINGIVLS